MNKELKDTALEISSYYIDLITENISDNLEKIVKDLDERIWETHKQKMMHAFMYKRSAYFSENELSRINNYLVENNKDALIYAEKQSLLQKIKELEEQNKDMNNLNQKLFREVKKLSGKNPTPQSL